MGIYNLFQEVLYEWKEYKCKLCGKIHSYEETCSEFIKAINDIRKILSNASQLIEFFEWLIKTTEPQPKYSVAVSEWKNDKRYIEENFGKRTDLVARKIVI